MKAALFYGAGDVRVEDVPEPFPAAGEIKLRVEWCGLCGTDVAEFRYGPLGTPVEPHPVTGQMIPVILGHELTGTVVEVGADVQGVSEGSAVLVNPMLSCGSCPRCLRGRPNICDFLGVHGLSGGGGGLAEFTVVPSQSVHPLPPNADLGLSTMAEPVAVALRSIRRSQVAADSTACIFGAGPIGLVLLTCLSSLGVRTWVVEPSPFRRNLALTLGAELAVEPASLEDLPVLEGGFDVVYEASGTQSALTAAVEAVCPGGTVMPLARFKRDGTLTVNLLRREIDLISTQAYIDEIPEAIDLVTSQSISVDPIVTDRIPLAEVVEAGFENLVASPIRTGKVLVKCS